MRKTLTKEKWANDSNRDKIGQGFYARQNRPRTFS